jgi:ATP-dependent DNA helicase RecQ
MAKDILLELGLAPENALYVSPRLRDRLVKFLLRWQQYKALDACLNELLTRRALQSLLDARAQMLLELGLLNEAWDTICQRHGRSASISSRVLAARIQLARGDRQDALAAVQSLVNEEPDSSMAWAFLGEVRLASGDIQSALASYHRVNDLAPGSRAYLLGMTAVHQAKGDWVTASAYAVHLQETARSDAPLPIAYLRRLRTYFEASREWNRMADIDAELKSRYASELTNLRSALKTESHTAPSPGREPALQGEMPSGAKTSHRGDSGRDARQGPALSGPLPAGSEKALDAVDTVPVSSQEREHWQSAAQRLFGFETLLPGQAEVMAYAGRGEDVLAVLPTGGGKSLCYQLPALMAESGTTLVISPLIALMKDQVDKLGERVGQQATTINSTLEGDELSRRLQDAKAGRYRLVYAAPERLRQPPFLHALRQAGINRLVIDEAHCVSIWGHDFRPDYLYVAQARQALGNPPLLAMTATAAPRVRQDILLRLGKMRITSPAR